MEGTLTSVDIDELCCRQLRERLVHEENPHTVEVICQNATHLEERNGTYDLVTIIGSTRLESGLYDEILRSAANLLKPLGEMYYMTLDNVETMDDFIQFAIKNQLRIENYLYEPCANFKMRFWRAVRIQP